MKCRECGQELTEHGTTDEYRLCHQCYCLVMDTTNTEHADKRAYYKQLALATKGNK